MTSTPRSNVRDQASSFLQASEEIIVFTGALRGHLQTNNLVLICKFTHYATSRRPTVTQMSLARSGSSFLHALAGSSARRVHLHLLVRIARHRSDRTIHGTSLPTPPPLSSLETSKDGVAARDWLIRFGACSIPRAAVDITFSRSSGPGGQVCVTVPNRVELAD